MKISDIKTENKERDHEICTLWLEAELPTEDIARRYDITARQVNRIVYKNREVLDFEVKHEKNKRIRYLKQQLSLKKNTRKDPVDLIKELRAELEGDKPNINVTQEQHDHITYRWEGRNNQVQPPRLPT